jgi:predicted nucleotidyltransferase
MIVKNGASDPGRAWIAAMPPAVARQRALLESLLDAVTAEPALRYLELGCSLARGAGDERSDIDCAVGLADEHWADALRHGRRLADGLGPVADQSAQPMPGRDNEPCWHLFSLYRDGSQLSMVLSPASWRPGLPPGSVALYDADERLARPWRPASLSAEPDTVRQWAALAWIALGDLAKYLDRGSLWEAHQRLEEARTQLWRLVATGQRAAYPGHGLTAVLDQAAPVLPAGIGATVAGLEPDALRVAAVATARLLTEATVLARQAVPFDPPDGLRAWVLTRLA